MFWISEILSGGNRRESETCYLWKKSTLEKLVFEFSERNVCHRDLRIDCLCFCTTPLEKGWLSDLKEECSNLGLKTLGEFLLLANNLFRFNWLNIKTNSKVIMVAIHPKLSADENFDMIKKGVTGYLIYMCSL